ncbi:hypothetical protein D3C73_1610690 [compost metagenome]
MGTRLLSEASEQSQGLYQRLVERRLLASRRGAVWKSEATKMAAVLTAAILVRSIQISNALLTL